MQWKYHEDYRWGGFMGRQYKIEPCCFGLMFKVVLFADNYVRRVMSLHFSRKGAVEAKKFYDSFN